MTFAALAIDVPILARLKSETRFEHEAIERALGLIDEGLTLERYRGILERFYGFYAPLEDHLWGVIATTRTFDLAGRRKTPLLRADLESLTGGAGAASLPLCSDLPPHDTVAACFGCLYVMEGATLGGQVISRHVRQVLGVTPELGGRFFHGYGDCTGLMWCAFRDAFATRSGPLAASSSSLFPQEEVVGAANATFRRLRVWCAGAHHES